MIEFLKNIFLAFKVLAGMFVVLFVLAFLDAGYEYKTCKSLINISTEPKQCKSYWATVAEHKANNSRYNPSTGKMALGSDKKTHRVRKGETLYKIARRYKVSVEALKRLNGDSETIFPKQIIRIE